jgi:ribonuclease HI
LDIKLLGTAYSRWRSIRRTCEIDDSIFFRLQEVMGGEQCFPLMFEDWCPKTHFFGNKFNVTIGSRENWAITNVGNDCISCYTDGSKLDNGQAGAGYCVEALNLDFSASLGIYTTVYQSEVWAIHECAQQLINNKVKDKTVIFYSDSRAALLSLNAVICKSALVKITIEVLNYLGIFNRVILAWVPGHSGIIGNENADVLAKRGAESEFYGPEPAIGVSPGTLRSKIQSWMDSLSCHRWNNTDACRIAKIYFGNSFAKDLQRWFKE